MSTFAPCNSGSGPYGDAAVRARMVDFLGGPPLDHATALFVVGRGLSDGMETGPLAPGELTALLDRGFEVSRSLWDRRSLVVDLDMEYVNFDFPGEAYLNPERSFGLQRPVVRAVRHLLAEHGIRPLHVLTGRGHHFLWQVDMRSLAFRRLSRLGRVPDSLHHRYARPHPPGAMAVPFEVGRAFAGLGLVMEHLGHRIRDLAEPESAIPVELAELSTNRPARGRELVVVDLSEYGDGLSLRHVAIPFTRYLKPYRNRGVVGAHVSRWVPMTWVIPSPDGPEPEALGVMRSETRVVQLARSARTEIPDQASGMADLVASYEASPLARAHDLFYSAEHDPPTQWHRTYDRTSLESLPPCARRILERPNDLLLRPGGILKVVRALLDLGWHPRHIAGLVRSKYERDHGWGFRWFRDDASARADYYVRLFFGMIALGRSPRDELHCPAGLAPEECRSAGCGPPA